MTVCPLSSSFAAIFRLPLGLNVQTERRAALQCRPSTLRPPLKTQRLLMRTANIVQIDRRDLEFSRFDLPDSLPELLGLFAGVGPAEPPRILGRPDVHLNAIAVGQQILDPQAFAIAGVVGCIEFEQFGDIVMLERVDVRLEKRIEEVPVCAQPKCSRFSA